MVKGKGFRILPILAAVLVSVGLGLAVILLLLREPGNRRFEETLRSAEFAVESGDTGMAGRQLLIASRHAVSAHNWRSLLAVSLRLLPPEPEQRDYRLFETLAGRASASISGEEEFRACWAWSLMRRGDLDRASRAISDVTSKRWTPIKSEITLKSAIGDEPEDMEVFISRINPGDDPEFLENAASLTGSAELAYDAALVYMRSGRVDDAYGMVQDISGGRYSWNRDDAARHLGTALGMASIAQDAGDRSMAIKLLDERVSVNRERRAAGWEELQMLGDLYWEQFLLTGEEVSRDHAYTVWHEAIEIVRSAFEADAVPENSWRLWVNQAVLEETRGRVRESRRLLDEGLGMYPHAHEVKASWALEMKDDEPALARRLARSAYEDSMDPVLGVTAIRLDPDTVSPRVYEARLWKLFEAATDPDSTMQASDARIIATFLLEYMTSRKNYSSIDVAVERFLKAHPDSDWILSWRLAADSARRMGIIDLVPAVEAGLSPYDEMRKGAYDEGSWRGMHDAAMYAIMTAYELDDAARRFYTGASTGGDSISPDAAILRILEPLAGSEEMKDQPMGDRLRMLLVRREDTEKARRDLAAGSRRGDSARADAYAVLKDRAENLREEALSALETARDSTGNLDGKSRASLLYLEALVLRDLGRIEESKTKAAAAVAADPEHARAMELE